MYNEQIEKLIELALADGELTQKEKDVLFRKAFDNLLRKRFYYESSFYHKKIIV